MWDFNIKSTRVRSRQIYLQFTWCAVVMEQIFWNGLKFQLFKLQPNWREVGWRSDTVHFQPYRFAIPKIQINSAWAVRRQWTHLHKQMDRIESGRFEIWVQFCLMRNAYVICTVNIATFSESIFSLYFSFKIL